MVLILIDFRLKLINIVLILKILEMESDRKGIDIDRFEIEMDRF